MKDDGKGFGMKRAEGTWRVMGHARTYGSISGTSNGDFDRADLPPTPPEPEPSGHGFNLLAPDEDPVWKKRSRWILNAIAAKARTSRWIKDNGGKLYHCELAWLENRGLIHWNNAKRLWSLRAMKLSVS